MVIIHVVNIVIILLERMTSQKEFDVMISYNTESGKKYMEKLRKKLKSKGYKVWVYTEQMYDTIYDGMARGVAGTYIVIALISEAYKESTNCMLELKQAQKLNKVIIPVKIENYIPPDDSSMSFILNDLVYYKVYGKFDETAKLIDAVEKQLGICKSGILLRLLRCIMLHKLILNYSILFCIPFIYFY